VDGPMRAVRGEDRRADVSVDMSSAEHACFAAALLAFQRGSAAIPALVPAAHDVPSSLHSVATRECGEAAGAVMRSVLEEDMVLGLGAEVRHGCVDCAADK
jgi:hypothetical protein